MPVKNLLPPTGYYYSWTNAPIISDSFVTQPLMHTATSPVFLNPRILVPRFALKKFLATAQLPINFQTTDLPVDSIESRCGHEATVTFPAVYKTQNGGIPAYGQIYPRGLD
jgi:hypothetical protein